MTTIHHPSCPVRSAIGNPAYCGYWPYKDHTDCASSIECQAVTVEDLACLCGPEAAAEDRLILSERTPDAMLLDVLAHAQLAADDWKANRTGRRTPKGLLSCVALDAGLPGPKSASWGVRA